MKFRTIELLIYKNRVLDIRINKDNIIYLIVRKHNLIDTDKYDKELLNIAEVLIVDRDAIEIMDVKNVFLNELQDLINYVIDYVGLIDNE